MYSNSIMEQKKEIVIVQEKARGRPRKANDDNKFSPSEYAKNKTHEIKQCECGAEVSYYAYNKHLKRAIHEKNMMMKKLL